MSEDGWEMRMAERARHRVNNARAQRGLTRYGYFVRYLRPDDPEEIIPEILAARCLGITYGDPGPVLPPKVCRQCWGERHVWLGNTWGMEHTEPGFNRCQHACHEGEVWLAAAV